MDPYSSKSRALVIAAALAAAVACEDQRVKAVDTGMTRDSVLKIVSKDAGAGPDSLKNIYRRERYLVAGKLIEVLYYLPTGQKLKEFAKDTVPWKKLEPIVMSDNKVVGKGWDVWDSVSKANQIPVRPHT